MRKKKTFEERNKDLIGSGDFEQQLSRATPIYAKQNKNEFWHRSRGMRKIIEEIESIIEDSKWTDYCWNGEDEIPVDVIAEDVAAKRILQFLLKHKILK